MADFYKTIDFVLQWEGGYSQDPRDPGGETSYGISKRAFPDLDIKKLTKEEAIAIYQKNYWVLSGAGTIEDDALALMHMDTAVNMGVNAALHILRDSGNDIAKYVANRVQGYHDRCIANPKLKIFFFGWINRTLAAYNEGKKK
jgi:lysozyme family protein